MRWPVVSAVVCVALLAHVAVTHAHSAGAGERPKPDQLRWDYGKGGLDWTGPCRAGKKQSPINIRTAEMRKTENRNVRFQYNDFGKGSTLENNGKTLLLYSDADMGFATVNRVKFSLKHVEFHTPSEHRVNGKAFDMEMQLFHRSDSAKGPSKMVAVSLLFDAKKGGDSQGRGKGKLGPRQRHSLLEQVEYHLRDNGVYLEEEDTVVDTQQQTPSSNPFLKSLEWCHAPVYSGNMRKINKHVSLHGGIKHTLEGPYWFYEGSLTRPPCTESVQWLVFKQVLPVTKGDVRVLQRRFRRNARGTQPWNGRRVTLIG